MGGLRVCFSFFNFAKPLSFSSVIVKKNQDNVEFFFNKLHMHMALLCSGATKGVEIA